MSDLLCGKCLNWACLDRAGVFATHLRDLLQRWADAQTAAGHAPVHISLNMQVTDWLASNNQKADTQKFIHTHLAPRDISLFAIHVGETTELEPACRVLAQLGQIPRRVERLCYLAPELSEWTPILLEAGAQTVVSQLTFLQSVLDRLLARVQLSTKGYHPLTSGLMERLPWQHLA